MSSCHNDIAWARGCGYRSFVTMTKLPKVPKQPDCAIIYLLYVFISRWPLPRRLPLPPASTIPLTFETWPIIMWSRLRWNGERNKAVWLRHVNLSIVHLQENPAQLALSHFPFLECFLEFLSWNSWIPLSQVTKQQSKWCHDWFPRSHGLMEGSGSQSYARAPNVESTKSATETITWRVSSQFMLYDDQMVHTNTS